MAHQPATGTTVTVFHATGKRVRELSIRLEKLLDVQSTSRTDRTRRTTRESNRLPRKASLVRLRSLLVQASTIFSVCANY
jgi:hypothetical protein